MNKALFSKIAKQAKVTEPALRVTLSRLKKRHDLKSIEQAACLYVKKKKLNINVSSIIDDVTRQVVQSLSTTKQPAFQSRNQIKKPTHRFNVPKIKWLPDRYYSLAQQLSEFYGYLFIFENALRQKIITVMSVKDSNWWENIIKKDLFAVYKYSEDEKKRQEKLPMVGDRSLNGPLDYLTVGHLEQIIVKYQKLFITSIFPNLQFFTGHMIIIKRVRNSLAHMSPSTISRDIRNARNEVDILLQYLSSL